MIRSILPWSAVVIALIASTAFAQPTVSETELASNTIQLEVFIRSDSEKSKQAAQFANELAARTNGLEAVVHDVLTDRAQLSRLWKLTRRSGRDKPASPAFYCCGRIQFGFANAKESGPSIEDLFTADVYTRATCPKCIAAKEFFRKLGRQWPALRFRIYEISNDLIARRRYQQLCESKGKLPGLPTIYFAGQVIVGYQGDDVTGAQFEQLLRQVSRDESGGVKAKSKATDSSYRRRHQKQAAAMLVRVNLPDQTFDSGTDSQSDDETTFDEDSLLDDLPVPEESVGIGSPAAEIMAMDQQTQATSDVIVVPWLGELRVSRLGLPLFTFLVGLIDGFNPCAMWILVFLLSVLVNIKDRRKIVLIAGTFVVVSGVAYFAFMAAWLNLFLLIGIARPAQVTLGLVALLIGIINVKDFFAFKKGFSLSIPESRKPGIYKRVREIVSAKYLTTALIGVVVLAVIVNMVELLCTAGLPAVYTQVLTMHELPTWKNYGYLGIYILAYMLDDTILLTIVVITLSHRRLQEREGRWLKLISGLAILALGLVMIFKPTWLLLGQ